MNKDNLKLIFMYICIILLVLLRIITHGIDFEYDSCIHNDTIKENFFEEQYCYQGIISNIRYKCEKVNRTKLQNYCKELYE